MKAKTWFSGNTLYQTYYNNVKRLWVLIKVAEMNLGHIKAKAKRAENTSNLYIINQNKG